MTVKFEIMGDRFEGAVGVVGVVGVLGDEGLPLSPPQPANPSTSIKAMVNRRILDLLDAQKPATPVASRRGTIPVHDRARPYVPLIFSSSEIFFIGGKIILLSTMPPSNLHCPHQTLKFHPMRHWIVRGHWR